jgi:hypothetical protein
VPVFLKQGKFDGLQGVAETAYTERRRYGEILFVGNEHHLPGSVGTDLAVLPQWEVGTQDEGL